MPSIHLDADGNPSLSGSHDRTVDESVTWPPPPSDDDVTRVVVVNERGRGRKVTGRVIRLWGQDVVVDDAGLVYCDYCKQFIALSELVAANNSHGVGLRPIDGAFLPLGSDATPADRSPHIGDSAAFR